MASFLCTELITFAYRWLILLVVVTTDKHGDDLEKGIMMIMMTPEKGIKRTQDLQGQLCWF